MMKKGGWRVVMETEWEKGKKGEIFLAQEKSTHPGHRSLQKEAMKGPGPPVSGASHGLGDQWSGKSLVPRWGCLDTLGAWGPAGRRIGG